MNVLIVYGTQYGTTEHIARRMGEALAPRHVVRVADVDAALPLTGDDVDLLLIGAPTQLHGWRLLVRPFLNTLREQAFVGVAAAAFDTRMDGPARGAGSAAGAIARRVKAAGCRLVAPPAGFLVAHVHGDPMPGEEDRAAAWAIAAAEAVAITA